MHEEDALDLNSELEEEDLDEDTSDEDLEDFGGDAEEDEEKMM